MIKKIANYPYNTQEQYYSQYQAPEAQYYEQYTPEQLNQIQQYYDTQQAPSEPVKKDTLLSAGLGAGLGMLGAGGYQYNKSSNNRLNKIVNAAKRFKDNVIDPTDQLVDTSTYKGKAKELINPKQVEKLKSENIANKVKVNEFLNKHTTPKSLFKRGLKGIKPGTIAKAGIGGGILGVLLNNYLADREQQG